MSVKGAESKLILGQVKATQVELKADMDKRTIKGYVATWTADEVGDIIKPGAFAKTIRERGPKQTSDGIRSKIKCGYNHRRIIGLPQVLKEDDYGVYAENKVDKTACDDEILEKIRSGTIDSNSFMYDVIDWDWDMESGLRVLKEIRMYEEGPVDFPANEAAVILGLKSHLNQMFDNVDGFMKDLREGKLVNHLNEERVRNAIEALSALLPGIAGKDAAGATTPTSEPTPPVEEPRVEEEEQKDSEPPLGELLTSRLLCKLKVVRAAFEPK